MADVKEAMRAATKFAADHIHQLAYEQVYMRHAGRLKEGAKLHTLREMLKEVGISSFITTANNIVNNMALRAVVNHPERPDDHVLEWREDGLGYCLICHGAEATMPTDCPGQEMTEAQQQAVQAGTMGFINGKWRHGNFERYRFNPVEEVKP